MIEAWWRSLKHQWLFLNSLDSVTTVRRLVAFYVQDHNQVLPHSAFRGQTPDEMYFYEAACQLTPMYRKEGLFLLDTRPLIAHGADSTSCDRHDSACRHVRETLYE
jgi:hypothetical protein